MSESRRKLKPKSPKDKDELTWGKVILVIGIVLAIVLFVYFIIWTLINMIIFEITGNENLAFAISWLIIIMIFFGCFGGRYVVYRYND